MEILIKKLYRKKICNWLLNNFFSPALNFLTKDLFSHCSPVQSKLSIACPGLHNVQKGHEHQPVASGLACLCQLPKYIGSIHSPANCYVCWLYRVECPGCVGKAKLSLMVVGSHLIVPVQYIQWQLSATWLGPGCIQSISMLYCHCHSVVHFPTEKGKEPISLSSICPGNYCKVPTVREALPTGAEWHAAIRGPDKGRPCFSPSVLSHV